MAYVVNTYQTIKNLTDGEVFTNAQAERIVDVVMNTNSKVATKADVNLAIDSLRKDMDTRLDKMDAKIDSNKTEIILNLTIKIYASMAAMCSIIIAAIAFI